MLAAGVRTLGDSRIENIERMRRAGVAASMTLIRSPMLSQAARVVANAHTSFNTELDVIRALSCAAQLAGRRHGVVLMVELGDLREGIMPVDLGGVVRETLRLPGVELLGLGANLACRSGVMPDDENMAELSEQADRIDRTHGPVLGIVSGGSSATLTWAMNGANTRRVNDLRIGEAILLGQEPLHRHRIRGLHTGAFTLVGEVIEAMVKPSQPWGKTAQTAFGTARPMGDRGPISHTLIAIGHQDTDPHGLTAPPGIDVLGASSDHLIIDAGRLRLPIGTEVPFQLNYSALIRAMASPFVAKVVRPVGGHDPATANHLRN